MAWDLLGATQHPGLMQAAHAQLAWGLDILFKTVCVDTEKRYSMCHCDAFDV